MAAKPASRRTRRPQASRPALPGGNPLGRIGRAEPVFVLAVVVMVSVDVAPLPPGVIEVGENEQVAAPGSPELQLSETVLLNPFTAAMLTVYTATCPATTVLSEGDAERL